MKIRFARFIGIGQLLLVGALAGVMFWASERGVDIEQYNAQQSQQDPMQNAYILIPAISIFGILSLLIPYGKYENREFVVRNSLGMIRSRYKVSKVTKLYEAKGRLYINRGEELSPERIRIAKIWSHKGDWKKLLQAASQDDITRDLHDI